MPETVNTCPLCQFNEHDLFETTIFRGTKVLNRICSRCGFVFQSPRMTQDELNTFYVREYRQVYQGDEGPTQKDLAVQDGRASALLKFVKGSISEIISHLDIGCSAGFLLGRFQAEYGCHSTGVEFSRAYRAYCQEQGLEVFADLSELEEAGRGKFDLISLAHVLEHIPDPINYLVDLHSRFLSEGGYLLLEVPNLYCHDSFEIAHMTSFSRHTLIETLMQSGFSMVASMNHGAPRSRLLPLYITVLAKMEKGVIPTKVQPEGWVKQKRRWGMLKRKVIQRLAPDLAWVPIKLSI